MKGPHIRFSRDTLGHAIDDLSTHQPAVIYTLVLALIVLIGIIDYLTGYELNFFVFYFIPIASAAWYINRRAALAFALASGLTWVVVDMFSGDRYSWWFYQYWNSAIRCVSFVIIALAVSTIKELLAQAFSEIRKLRSLLPIRAACKRIRDDTGYWEQVEVYMSNH